MSSLLVFCLLSLSPSALGPEAEPGVITGLRDALADVKPRTAYPHLPPQPSTPREKADRFDAIIIRQSDENGLDPRLVKAIIAAESEFSTWCVSPRGALGLMQVMPATAEEMGIPRWDLVDPESNIRAGTAYLNLLFRAAWTRYGLVGNYRTAPPWVLRRVIAAYHGGPRFLYRKEWPHQTRIYVRNVMRLAQSPEMALRPWPWIAQSPKRMISLTQLTHPDPGFCGIR